MLAHIWLVVSGMTRPFPAVPGSTYMSTRMCLDQLFLMHPDSEVVSQVIEYTLARAKQLTGAKVHAYCAMSNHPHIEHTDVSGKSFEQRFYSLAGRMLNSHRDREGYFFGPRKQSRVLLVDHQDQLERIGYIAAQPIAAGIFDKAKHWKGAMSSPRDLGKKRDIKRPKVPFVSKDTSLPESIEFELDPLPGQEGMPLSEAIAEQLAAVDKACREARAERYAAGKGFLGKEGLKKISWKQRSQTEHPFRAMSPQVACKDRQRRIAVLRELREFRRAYREALDKYLAGDREVVFPYGTNKLRPYVRVAAAPPAT